MTPRRLKKFVLAVATAACSAGAAGSEPAGWFLASQQGPDGMAHFTAGLDSTVAFEGTSSGFIRSNFPGSGQSGTLMQTASAQGFEGKAVSFRAWLRSRDVAGIAGLWLRVEDANGGVVAFRNCYSSRKPGENRSAFYISGTTEWSAAELTIDVPDSAAYLFYGVQLIGSGKVWIDSVSLDVRGPATDSAASMVPVIYNPVPDRSRLKGPSNLDFEQERARSVETHHAPE